MSNKNATATQTAATQNMSNKNASNKNKQKKTKNCLWINTISFDKKYFNTLIYISSVWILYAV